MVVVTQRCCRDLLGKEGGGGVESLEQIACKCWNDTRDAMGLCTQVKRFLDPKLLQSWLKQKVPSQSQGMGTSCNLILILISEMIMLSSTTS